MSEWISFMRAPNRSAADSCMFGKFQCRMTPPTLVDVPLLRCALYFLDNRTQLYAVCGGLTWVFSASPAHGSSRQTNRHTLQETSRIAYLDDLIVVIRIGDAGTSV